MADSNPSSVPSSSNDDSSTFALPFNAFFSLISFVASVNIAVCIGASLTFATAQSLLGSSADQDLARASKGAVWFAWGGASNAAALIMTLLVQLLYTSPTFVGVFVRESDGNIRTSGKRDRVNTIGSLNLATGGEMEKRRRRHYSDSTGGHHDPEPQLPVNEPAHGGFREKWMRWLMGMVAWISLAFVAAGLGLIGEGMKVVDERAGSVMEWMLLLFGLPVLLFWGGLRFLIRVEKRRRQVLQVAEIRAMEVFCLLSLFDF